jgi:hypothetical protein
MEIVSVTIAVLAKCNCGQFVQQYFNEDYSPDEASIDTLIAGCNHCRARLTPVQAMHKILGD